MDPFTLLIKPSGSECNNDCAYCFYKGRSPEFGRGKQRMSLEVLERLIQDYMQTGFPVVGFAWQGGEPTLMGIQFFQKVVELQKKYGIPGQQVSNTFQTNGLVLGKSWCRFFHDKKFLLGISIDGPREFHDRYRLDHRGAGTHARVLRGIENCKKQGVQFSALLLLNNRNVEHPDELFDFVVNNDLTYLQFIPCLETNPDTGQPADYSITPGQYGDFLCRLFDLWRNHGTEKMNIREFDSITTYHVLGKHTICTYSKNCAGFIVIEHNGDAFCCEFFVEPRWRLGNILERPLVELAASSRKQTFSREKQDLPETCHLCQYLHLCWGGCRKNRIHLENNSTCRENYFCESYRQFFEHSLPGFREIARAIKEGRLGRHTRSIEDVRYQIQ